METENSPGFCPELYDCSLNGKNRNEKSSHLLRLSSDHLIFMGVQKESLLPKLCLKRFVSDQRFKKKVCFSTMQEKHLLCG